MEFNVIDTKTGKPAKLDDLLQEEWLKQAHGVFYIDFDDYYISSGGQIVLMDDCGNTAYPPSDRLVFVPLLAGQKLFTPEEVCGIMVEKGKRDPKFKLGESIKYSPSEVLEMLKAKDEG